MADLFWFSDEQWAVIEPFMPRDQPGPERRDDRQIISGILNQRLGEHRLDRIGEALQAIDHGKQHVLDAAVPQLVHDA